MSDTPAVTPRALPLRRLAVWSVLLAIVFVALMALGAQFAQADTRTALATLSVPLLLVLLLASVANYLVRAWRWGWLAQRLDADMGWPSAARVYLAGFAAGATPGRLGELIRVWFMRRGHGLPVPAGLAMVAADRVGDLAAVTVLSLWLLPGFVGLPGWATLLLCLVLLLALWGLLRGSLLRRAFDLAYWLTGRRFPRWFASGRHFARSVAGLAAAPTAALILAAGVVAWLAECVAWHWLLGAMGATLPLAASVGIYALATLVGALSMLPGGLIGFEATAVGLLLAAGVSGGTAVAATAVIRITTFWFSVLVGLAVLPLAWPHPP